MSDNNEERDRAVDAREGECVVPNDGSGDADWSPFDELQDDFNPGPTVYATGADGLPAPVHATARSDIPVLSPQTLVCMGDFSQFVIRDELGRVDTRFSREQVYRLPNGRYYVPVENEHLLPPTLITEKVDEDDHQEWVEVQPLRPPCRHYVRQQAQFELNAEHMVQYRVCAARRTTEGAMMTVRDLAVFACDMREPFDIDTAGRMDEFDEKKMAEGRRRAHLPMFGNNIFDGEAS